MIFFGAVIRKYMVHVTACRLRKGLIQEVKLLVVAPPRETVLLAAFPLRRTSTEAVRKNYELLHQLIGSVMCSEWILHMSASDIVVRAVRSFEFDDPFPVTE